MKKLSFNTLAKVYCKDCGKAIKQRLVEKENPNKFCYECWIERESKRGHFIDSKCRVKRIKAGLPVKKNLRKDI